VSCHLKHFRMPGLPAKEKKKVMLSVSIAIWLHLKVTFYCHTILKVERYYPVPAVLRKSVSSTKYIRMSN
jgi:hypothetical protein